MKKIYRNVYWEKGYPEFTEEIKYGLNDDHPPDDKDPAKKGDEDIFHLGDYTEEPVKKLICTLCGGDNFKVGSGSHFTAIKCVKCEWEWCVHEG